MLPSGSPLLSTPKMKEVLYAPMHVSLRCACIAAAGSSSMPESQAGTRPEGPKAAAQYEGKYEREPQSPSAEAWIRCLLGCCWRIGRRLLQQGLQAAEGALQSASVVLQALQQGLQLLLVPDCNHTSQLRSSTYSKLREHSNTYRLRHSVLDKLLLSSVPL